MRWSQLSEDDPSREPYERAHAEALAAAVSDALEAFSSERTRANLERVWAAQKARDDYQERHFPSVPPVAGAPVADTYKGEHAAPDHESGYPLWNLTGSYPADFYAGHAAQYVVDDLERGCLGTMLALRNRPNAPITVYRAVPKAVQTKINAGDWVTISRRYAVEHGRDNLRNDYRIISKTVFARDLFTDGNSAAEWGYDPQPRVARQRVIRP